MSAAAAAVPAATAPQLYLYLAGGAMAVGSIVLMEPAPYDLALIALLGAGILLRRLRFVAEHRLPIAVLAAYLAVVTFSLLSASDVTTGVRYAAIDVYMVLAWLFFVGVTTGYGDRAPGVLLAGYTAAALVAIIPAALAFSGLLRIESSLRYGRAQGFFKDPNVYGPYLVVALVFVSCRLERCRRLAWKFAALAALSAVLALGLFLSYSRGAWLNSGITLAGYSALRFLADVRRRTVPWRLIFALGALLVAGGGVLGIVLAGDSSASRLLKVRLGRGGLQNYDSVRFYVHSQAMKAATEQPSGLGPGQSEVVFNYATHNMYLRILTEAGSAGFVLLYGFLLLSLVRAIRGALIMPNSTERDVFALTAAAIIGICISGLVIDTFHWRHFWFLLGLAWWAPRPGENRA